MSMIPCPGCGLPRIEEQIGTVPCPVCAAAPPDSRASRPGLARKAAGPDPTAGLPADVGELHRCSPNGSGGFPRWFGWAAVFFLGGAAGAAGILGWQAVYPPAPRIEIAKNEPADTPPLPQLPAKRIEVAPMPREAEPRPEPEPEPEPPPPEPKVAPLLPPPERIVIIELNQPDGTYTLPFTMKKGERVVLKGKVKLLKVPSLDGGAVLDASGLEAASIYTVGKIDNRSVLKLNAPNGTITMATAVVGKSSVEIVAPGGDVKFSAPTTPARPGSAIDGGSTVTITARNLELKGDVNGSDTKVTINIPRTGSLKVVAVRGTATVEYRVAADGKGIPEVSAAFVSPAATFRMIE